MKKLKGLFGGKGQSGSASAAGPAPPDGAGYAIKDKDLSKLHKAAWTGDIGKVKQLARKDPSALDKENRTPLHLACVQGHVNVVQELLEWNARTNIGDNNAKTPLMKAVECGQEGCVKLLFDYHVDVDQSDGDGNTALHLAVKDGNVPIAKDIVAAGAKLNTRNKMGYTPLHLSILDSSRRDELTRVLLASDADPNIADNSYRTPLHHACNEDAINHVKLLLQYNASTAMKDSKGWTAEDCAMMKANHGCSQLVFNHNLKQQKSISRTIPSTPRSGASSLPPSSHTTPRDKSASDFGLPQAPKEDAYDSDDPTLSKGSGHDERTDSWADNTDVSSAMDDHKDKRNNRLEESDLDDDLFGEEAPVKVSVIKHVNLEDSDEEELGTGPSYSEGSRKSPGPRPGSGDVGGTVRPMYSRTPSPDGTRSPLIETQETRGGGGKKPVKQTVSGASHTTVEDDFTDEDEEEEEEEDDYEEEGQPIQKNRVSFKQEHDIKNISTEDDSEGDEEEEDEEEVEPTKKRRIETPEEASGRNGYMPTGASDSSTPNLSQDKIKAMMKDLGMEDISDFSEAEDSESVISPRESTEGSKPTTPRSILKKNDTGKPPSNQQPIETDQLWDSEEDDEGTVPPQASQIVVEAEINLAAVTSPEKDDDWDSTQASETTPDHRQPHLRHPAGRNNGAQSPEYDSDLEGTLNPENSQVEKGPHAANVRGEIEEQTDAHYGSPGNESDQDPLAGTGEINALVIGELNESTDFSHAGSRSSSAAVDTPVAMTVIEEERTEISDSDRMSDTTQRTQISLKKRDSWSGDETIDKIEITNTGNTDTHATGNSKMSLMSSDDVNSISDRIGLSSTQNISGKEDSLDNKQVAAASGNTSHAEDDDGHADDEFEPDNLVMQEMDYFQQMEKLAQSGVQPGARPDDAMSETSIKTEPEISHSEGRGKHSASIHSADFKVIDRHKAPRCVFEYEPSTTDADSDTDTLDTESLVEDFSEKKAKKSARKHSPKNVFAKPSGANSLSLATDNEVARALAIESGSSAVKRHMIESQDDFVNRASVEPTSADTMDDQASLEETSQWDSTEEAYTPRTPRDLDGGQFTSPGEDVVEFEEEEDESIQDQINLATTSFSSKPVVRTPEPERETPSSRSRETPDTPTTSTSLAQKTVIAAEVLEPSPRSDGPDEEDEESDWDSEDDVRSDRDDTPVIGLASDTPRTPRQETNSTMSDPESASEWEIERQRQRDEEILQRKLAEQEDQLRLQDEAEAELQRQREQEEREIMAEIAAEEERQAELQRLAELEEEEERQRQWEEEESRRQEERRREAEAELEKERSQEISDFSDEDSDAQLPLPVTSPDQLHSHHSQGSYHSHPSHHSQGSEGSSGARQSRGSSQHSAVKVPADRSLEMKSPVAGMVLSPRTLGLKRPPPKLNVSQFITSPHSPKDSRYPVQIGEIENESPAPIYENLPKPSDAGQPLYSSPPIDAGALYSSPPPSSSMQIITPPSENKYAQDVVEAESDVGVEEIGEEARDEDLEDEESEELEPFLERQMTVLRNHPLRSEPPRVLDLGQNGDDHEGALLGTPPPLPASEPPGGHPAGTPGKAMSLRSDGNSADEDDLDDLDLPGNNKTQGRTSLNFPPELSGTTGMYMSGLDVPFDDDGLSVTSTENGDISSTSFRPDSLPYGKDMLVNMNLSDSNAVLKLQEHLREHRRQLEHERGQKSLLDNKMKLMTKDKAQMQKTVDSLKYQKSALEQSKLDLEAKIRNLEYSINEEEEKRKNAELLLKKTKDHLAKKEEQFTQEMEAKQRAELSMRNVQMELRSAQNTIREIEEEKVELERKLTNEKKGRELQEKINDEQQRLQQHMHDESLKTSSQREEAKSALELADDSIKYNKDLVEKYRNETLAFKAEIERQRQRLTDENSLLSADVEKLTARCEDLRGEVRLNEEALTQLTLQHSLQQNKMASEMTSLGNNLDRERVAREKIEAELESSRNRLQTTTIQLEKAQQARSEFERRLHSDREDWARNLERKDQEVEALREKLNTVMHTLNVTETKLNSVENELQISNTTLLERTNQQQMASRDVQYYKTAQDNFDSNYRHEKAQTEATTSSTKEQNAKLQGKIETLQERVSSLQHDNLNLKQQLETAQNVANDRSGLNLQDKLNTMISNLKADHDKSKASLEEKNASLQDTISRLREEIRNSENRRSNMEQDIRKYTQEQTDLIRKLSVAEASLDVAQKSRDSLEKDRLSLKMELEQLGQRYNSAQERTIEAQGRASELISQLDKTEQSRQASNRQLADTSATMQMFNSSKHDLEENYQKLQVDHVRLDAELKHEKQKTDMLNRDLQDSQKVRSSLEALCSNLKSTNAHLEEKLGPEQLREVTASNEATTLKWVAKDAEEHKGLWEQEVISRSKLGLRIAQLERHKQETTSQLEEEKRKTRKALDQKKLTESKLESEQERCSSLQKEVASLKAYLKVAKKKLKAMDTNVGTVSHLHSAFDKEREAMEEMLTSVKSQLEFMKIQLQEETEEKEKVHEQKRQLENELKAIKKLERSVQKIDRSKRKLEEEFKMYKNSVEVGYMEKGTVEEARKEIENRYRLELNRKLDEVNGYLEEQARSRQRLDTSREEHDSKLRSEKRKLEEEVTDVRIKYEQAVAQKETKEMEAKRYRDLYESEMQWRMRLTDQLHSSADKTFSFKNKLLAEKQKNRLFGSMNNLSMNGHNLDISRINGSLGEDALSNKLKAELDRSIAKHLEAAPHDQIRPLIRADDPVLAHSSFAKANSDYIELLKRKYCV